MTRGPVAQTVGGYKREMHRVTTMMWIQKRKNINSWSGHYNLLSSLQKLCN